MQEIIGIVRTNEQIGKKEDDDKLRQEFLSIIGIEKQSNASPAEKI